MAPTSKRTLHLGPRPLTGKRAAVTPTDSQTSITPKYVSSRNFCSCDVVSHLFPPSRVVSRSLSISIRSSLSLARLARSHRDGPCSYLPECWLAWKVAIRENRPLNSTAEGVPNYREHCTVLPKKQVRLPLPKTPPSSPPPTHTRTHTSPFAPNPSSEQSLR